MKLGTRVKNKLGWHGTIVNRPTTWEWDVKPNNQVVYVDWEERKKMIRSESRDNHSIKESVISARIEDLEIISS